MPLVIHRHRKTFLHIPKTGGTWVRKGLQTVPDLEIQDVGGQHDDWGHSADVCPRYDRFTVIRNPWDWYASYWAHRCRERWENPWLVIDRDCWSYNFTNFLHMVRAYQPGFLGRLYADYFPPANEYHPGFEYFKTRTLTDQFVDYLERMHLDFDPDALKAIPPENSIAHLKKVRKAVAYTPELERMIGRSEEELINKFGFTPSPGS